MEIRAAQVEDIPSVKDLIEASFGKHGGLEKKLQKWIAGPGFSVQVAVQGEKVLGVCVWHIRSDHDLSRFEPFGANAIEFMKEKRIAGVLNLVVAPEWRKKGLGTKLALASKKWLQNQNCDIVIGSSWQNGTQDNSAGLFRKAGFKVLGQSSDFLRLQLGDKSECSACKTRECRCVSILFGITYPEFAQLTLN